MLSLHFTILKIFQNDKIYNFRFRNLYWNIITSGRRQMHYEHNPDIEYYQLVKKTKYKENEWYRIVGGTETKIRNYPFIVSFQNIEGSHLCGGSLITKSWVLTASHCVIVQGKGMQIRNSKYYVIVAGQTDVRDLEWGNIREIKRFVPHPKFSKNLLLNDIALIELKNQFKLSDNVKLAVLPGNDLQHRNVHEKYDTCLAIGWGSQRKRKPEEEDMTDEEQLYMDIDLVAPTLMVVRLPLINTEHCKRSLGDSSVTNRQICTMYKKGGKDACEGDSGGPLVCGSGNIQYGITSWGQGCAMPNIPAVFTRVDTYTDWINNVIENDETEDYYSDSSKKYTANYLQLILLIFFYY